VQKEKGVNRKLSTPKKQNNNVVLCLAKHLPGRLLKALPGRISPRLKKGRRTYQPPVAPPVFGTFRHQTSAPQFEHFQRYTFSILLTCLSLQNTERFTVAE